MDQRYIVALELSGSQIKGAVATASASPYEHASVPKVEAIVCDDKANCVQYGRVHNLIDAATHTLSVIDKLQKSDKLKGSQIVTAYVALGGRSFGSTHASAEIILPHEMEITAEILRELSQEASKKVIGEKKVVMIYPRKYIVDNQARVKPEGSVGTKIKGEFTLVTCNPSNRRNLEMLFKDRVKLEIREYIITPLAVADLVLQEDEKQLGCMLVDLGAQTTTVSIYKDRALQYLVTLPIGSQNITHDLAIGLNITDEKAELTKYAQSDAMPNADLPFTQEEIIINNYTSARANEIVANIMAQIGFAGYKPAELPAGIILTGRGAKLKNFRRLVATKSQMKVRPASLPNSIDVAERSVNPNDYISLLSVVARAAKSTDTVGCIKFPTQAEADNHYAPKYPPFDPFDDKDNDITWTLDDDVADQRKQEMERQSEIERQNERNRELRRQQDEADRAYRQQQRREEVQLREQQRQEAAAAARARKEAEQREKEAIEAQKREAKAKKKEDKRNHQGDSSSLKTMKHLLERLINYDPDTDDTDLGDN